MAIILSRTARRVEDWQARGLIDAETARVLLDDLGAARTSRSFAAIAIWLGIVCLAFGAMTFVAANWDEMPRLLRMIVLMGGVLVSYIVAGLFHRRGNPGAAEAFIVLGCGVFGAAVMFTGQMYHLPGPPSGGVFLWALGTYAAAIVTGARGALGLAVILATCWSIMSMTVGDGAPFHPLFVPVWLVLAVTVWVMQIRGIAHLCAIAALAWVGLSIGIIVSRDEAFTAGYLAVASGFAAISIAILSATTVRVLRGFEGAAVFYILVLIGVMLGFMYVLTDIQSMPSVTVAVPAGAVAQAVLAIAPIWMQDERFDHVLAAVWIGVTVLVAYLVDHGVPYTVETFALAVSIWVIRMGGRQGWGPVTGLGYAGFALTMLVIYAAAAHGLLGTSLFYLIAGALLLIGAYAVPRLVAVRAAP